MIERVKVESEKARKQLSQALHDNSKEAHETGAQCIIEVEKLKQQLANMETKLKEFADEESDEEANSQDEADEDAMQLNQSIKDQPTPVDELDKVLKNETAIEVDVAEVSPTTSKEKS